MKGRSVPVTPFEHMPQTPLDTEPETSPVWRSSCLAAPYEALPLRASSWLSRVLHCLSASHFQSNTAFLLDSVLCALRMVRP